jgi:hypothetical protein
MTGFSGLTNESCPFCKSCYPVKTYLAEISGAPKLKDMLSPKLMREMQKQFDALAQSAIEPGNYTGSLFDVAFEITTAETFIAGVASKIIDGNRITKKDMSIVQRPLLLEGRWWQCDDGSVSDLGVNPEINRRALAIEQLRAACATALKPSSSQAD